MDINRIHGVYNTIETEDEAICPYCGYALPVYTECNMDMECPQCNGEVNIESEEITTTYFTTTCLENIKDVKNRFMMNLSKEEYQELSEDEILDKIELILPGQISIDDIGKE